jgi:hypothetical protein
MDDDARLEALTEFVAKHAQAAIDRKHGAVAGLTLTLGEAAHLCGNPVKEAACRRTK